jgi:hypothetical protein
LGARKRQRSLHTALAGSRLKAPALLQKRLLKSDLLSIGTHEKAVTTIMSWESQGGLK